MNQKNTNFNFKKNINKYSNNHNSINYHNARNKVKEKIMNKYHVSWEESEKILYYIENNKNKDIISKKTDSTFRNSKSNSKTNNSKKYDDFHNIKLNNHDDFDSRQNISKRHENDNNLTYGKSNSYQDKNSSKNVDSILEDIISNYNQQVSVKVDNVNLTFEVQNEKVDTLKETFIRTLKRDKIKKLKVHALKNVSFEIYKGEKVGIIGYNGAGKSTLLNVITGIYQPDNGNVVTSGNISPLLSLGAGFDYNYSGRKNIILNGAVLGYDKEYLESKIDEIIEFSELGEFIDIPIKNYSSGMLAKLGFSIATSVNPDILIIDEILSVGDVNFQKKSTDKMKSLMDGGTTVIIVSHSIPQIRELCDKAIWVDNGEIKEIGEVNKVCDHYLKDAEKASNQQLANIQFR